MPDDINAKHDLDEQLKILKKRAELCATAQPIALILKQMMENLEAIKNNQNIKENIQRLRLFLASFENEKAAQKSLVEELYNFSLFLTKYWPLNSWCPITKSHITEENRYMLANGYQCDRTALAVLCKAYGSNNPATKALKFNSDDIGNMKVKMKASLKIYNNEKLWRENNLFIFWLLPFTLTRYIIFSDVPHLPIWKKILFFPGSLILAYSGQNECLFRSVSER